MLKRLVDLDERSICVADVGAGFFGEPAPYQPLIEQDLCKLYAFEPDARVALSEYPEGIATVLPCAIGDGREHTFYICPDGLGMSSLLEPDPDGLGFFRRFPEWGRVVETQQIATRRLDDIDELPAVDFLKMDAQGSELRILENGRTKLEKCVAVHTEVSFVTLYKGQPTFGDVDQELRRQGFIPHQFAKIKNWPVSTMVPDIEVNCPFNQLLEADVVYIRDIIHPDTMDDKQIAKLAAIAHYVYGSADLAVRCILELRKRGVVGPERMAA